MSSVSSGMTNYSQIGVVTSQGHRLRNPFKLFGVPMISLERARLGALDLGCKFFMVSDCLYMHNRLHSNGVY